MTVISGLYSTEKAGEVKGRMLRRTMIRYIILAYCIALRAVSFRLKKRFPSLEHLVYVGVMTEAELRMFRRLDEKTQANKWFLPLVWAARMVGTGVTEGFIPPPAATALTQEINDVRERLQSLLSYDWVSVPLVYTQTVTIATYLYFAIALIGSQWVSPQNQQMFRGRKLFIDNNHSFSHSVNC